MDTNLLEIIDRLLAAKSAAPDGQSITIVVMLINAGMLALNTTLTFLARHDSAKTHEAATKTSVAADKTAEAVQKIEIHTNGERSATLALVDDLRSEMLTISKENSTLKEQQRGNEVAKEVAQARQLPKSAEL